MQVRFQLVFCDPFSSGALKMVGGMDQSVTPVTRSHIRCRRLPTCLRERNSTSSATSGMVPGNDHSRMQSRRTWSVSGLTRKGEHVTTGSIFCKGERIIDASGSCQRQPDSVLVRTRSGT